MDTILTLVKAKHLGFVKFGEKYRKKFAPEMKCKDQNYGRRLVKGARKGRDPVGRKTDRLSVCLAN